MNAVQQIRKLALAIIFILSPSLAFAGPPKVVTSIKPVQGLVLAVLGDGGEADALLPPGTSPHAFTLSPSQAQMLQDADVVFWMGGELETSLEQPLKSLSSNAKVVKLLDTPELDFLRINGAIDPHVWLSPDNVKRMINMIEYVLTNMDSGNAAVYAKNAKVARNRLNLLKRKTHQRLEPSKHVPYIVQHDGFGYLARDFGLNQVGYLQTMHGREPGAKHVSAIRDVIKSNNLRCLFVEPQFTSALADGLTKEFKLKMGEIDPMGTDLALSPTLPLRLIQSIILQFDTCMYKKPKKPATE